jgi:hypothetical protein
MGVITQGGAQFSAGADKPSETAQAAIRTRAWPGCAGRVSAVRSDRNSVRGRDLGRRVINQDTPSTTLDHFSRLG